MSKKEPGYVYILTNPSYFVLHYQSFRLTFRAIMHFATTLSVSTTAI